MSVTINGSGAITFNDGSVQNTASLPGMRNRLINGAMQIDQRNLGASVTATSSAPYTLDRWQSYSSTTGKFTVQQNAGSVTPPAGFKNYLGCTSTSAYSISSTDIMAITQYVEGLNVSDLAWGTANAATVTLSFWVYSSLTGTFGGALQNSAQNRNYPFSFTISASNTWEQKTITIAGDTTGTWLTTNGKGMAVSFSLGTGATYSSTAGVWTSSSFINSATGATSVVGTNGATFYITGVQLEKGFTATSFDYRPYGTELALCQRYFISLTPTGMIGYVQSSTNPHLGISFPVEMRSSGTATYSGSAACIYGGANSTTVSTFATDSITANGLGISATSSSVLTAGQAVRFQSGLNVKISSEL